MNAVSTIDNKLMYNEFTVSKDIFSFLSLYGMVPVYESRLTERLKIFRTKEDIQSTVYTAEDVCKFINTLTKRETVEVFNKYTHVGTFYKVKITTNSDKIVARLIKGLSSYNTEFKVDSEMEEYRTMLGETKMYRYKDFFKSEENNKDLCVVSVLYNTSESSYEAMRVKLAYDADKDIFIEGINMWIDCLYAKPYKGVKLVRVNLITENGELCAKCKAVFNTAEDFINMVEQTLDESLPYSISLSEVAKVNYSNCKANTTSKEVPQEVVAEKVDIEPMNDEAVTMTAPSPTITDSAEYGRVYRQTSGGYHNG